MAPIGRNGLAQLIAIVADPNDNTLPDDVRAAVGMLAVQLRLLNEHILEWTAGSERAPAPPMSAGD